MLQLRRTGHPGNWTIDWHSFFHFNLSVYFVALAQVRVVKLWSSTYAVFSSIVNVRNTRCNIIDCPPGMLAYIKDMFLFRSIKLVNDTTSMYTDIKLTHWEQIKLWIFFSTIFAITISSDQFVIIILNIF